MRLSSCRRLVLLWILGSASTANSQTTITGSQLIYKSTGAGFNGDWTIDRNGYVGTYVELLEPGSVTINVNASGMASGDADPHMNIVIADAKVGFDVAGGFQGYEHTFDLPAGVYFVRTEFTNDVEVSPRALTVRDLTVTGATVLNDANPAVSNTSALSASDTYIDNFRKGNVTIGLSGLAPGTNVDVRLKRHAFNFGTAVPGSNLTGVNNYLGSGGTARQTNYQARLLENFNAVVPENAGKWGSQEGTRNSQNMAAVDLILDFAQAHDMNARMHNLIWGDNSGNGQQPSWVLNNNENGLLDLAAEGDATAAADLRDAISHRIDYYVGDGPGGFEDQAPRIAEIDVYNESIHTGWLPGSFTHNYWTAYGPAGVAGIYNEVREAVAEAGAATKLFVNEYSVLGSSAQYMQHIDDLRQTALDAGYGEILGGIGAQYYPSGGSSHVPTNVFASMQNYAVQALPFALTEFGASNMDELTAASVLEEMMRLVFGNPDSSGFFMWGFHQGGGSNLFAPAAALYTVSGFTNPIWTITPAGTRYSWLFGRAEDPVKRGANPLPWDTQLTAVVGDDGTINFDGFWGEYELLIGGQVIDLELVKGTTTYSLVIAEGDYNGDGVVGAADYTVWRDTLGSTTDLRADGNGNRVIDGGDYGVWKSRFGTTYGGGARSGVIAAVPEPAGLVLVVGAIGLCNICVRGRRYHGAKWHHA